MMDKMHYSLGSLPVFLKEPLHFKDRIQMILIITYQLINKTVELFLKPCFKKSLMLALSLQASTAIKTTEKKKTSLLYVHIGIF